MTHQAARSRSPIAAHPFASAAIAILMAANIFFVLYTPIYSKVTPKVGDFPFFYFYLLIFMPITVVLTLILKAVKAPAGTDETLPHQYTADPAPTPAPAPAGVGLRSGSE